MRSTRLGRRSFSALLLPTLRRRFGTVPRNLPGMSSSGGEEDESTTHCGGTFIDLFVKLEDMTEVHVKAELGPHRTLLTALADADLSDVWEGGACGGACSCSTCRVVLEPPLFELLGETEEDEEDMLDQAEQQGEWGEDGGGGGGGDARKYSRLSCQIPLTKALDKAVIDIPDCTPVNMLEIPLWLRKR